MERGSDKHSARMDDALESEVRGMMQAGRETRGEAWHSAEPSGEDQPDVDLNPDGTLAGGVPDGMTEADVETRSELATFLGRSVWPATGQLLLETAQSNEAPDRVLQVLRRLPSGREYANLQEAWAAASGGVEEHRF